MYVHQNRIPMTSMDKEAPVNTEPPKIEDIPIDINCQEHPSEKIERICTDSAIEKDLVCIECLLNLDDPTNANSSLQTVGEFVEGAS